MKSNPLDDILGTIPAGGSGSTTGEDTSVSYNCFGVSRDRGCELEDQVYEGVKGYMLAQVDDHGSVSGDWGSLYKEVVEPLAKNPAEALWCAMAFGQVRAKIMSDQKSGGMGEQAKAMLTLLKLLGK